MKGACFAVFLLLVAIGVIRCLLFFAAFLFHGLSVNRTQWVPRCAIGLLPSSWLR